jgi:D-alanine-D-alanine ligase-like ATP-grasp enzyme
MKIAHHVFWGPNPYSDRPCVAFRLQECAREEAVRALSAYVKLRSILYRLPGFPAEPDPGPPSDFEALFVDLPRLVLPLLNHVRGELTQGGGESGRGAPVIFIEFHHPDLVRRALRILIDFLLDGSEDRATTLHGSLESLWQDTHAHHPDFQAHALIASARARGIHYANVGRKLWCYGIGRRSRTFFETSPVEDLAHGIKTDKLSGKHLFESVGAPTARYRVLRSRSELDDAVREIGFPCVIKPVHAGGGRGVTANIRCPAQIDFAYREALRHCKDEPLLMVEEHIEGRDHRLLFVQGIFVGCASSVAPSVTGDGRRSIGELIDAINAGRTRNLYASGYLRPIKTDAAMHEALAVQGLARDSVPAPGQTVILRRNTNLGGGGFSELFEQVDPEVVGIAARIAAKSELYSVGIDYITRDIRATPAASGGRFTELNKMPGVPLFLAAGFDVATLGDRFLGDGIGNIPVILSIRTREDLARARPARPGPGVVVLQSSEGSPADHAWPGPWFRDLIAGVMRDRRLERILIIAELERIEAHGFPVGCLSKVIVGPGCRTRTIEATVARLRCEVVFD